MGEKGREWARIGENGREWARMGGEARIGYRGRSVNPGPFPMATHERLRAWQLCHELALAVYEATDTWPRDERYGLTAQARRAAHSAAANIAEGWAKHGRRELQRYLSISRGSLAELGYTLRLAFDRGLVSEPAWRKLRNLRDAAEATTWKLYKSVSHPEAR